MAVNRAQRLTTLVLKNLCVTYLYIFRKLSSVLPPLISGSARVPSDGVRFSISPKRRIFINEGVSGDTMKGRGQAWSMDLIIGVLVFMLAIGIIYTVLSGKDRGDIAPLRIESEVIATKLSDDPTYRIADNNQIDQERLEVLLGNATQDYEGLKAAFGVKNEFCIYLRDESGNLTYIVDGDGNAYSGIGSGSGEFNLSGTPCGCRVGSTQDSTPNNCYD